MREKLERNLEAIGLSDKEARVYLAALELGQSTAQTLAAKATVNRPTTYIMIESLVKRGLMSSVEKGTKRHFTAAAPEQLLEIMAGQRKEIQAKEELVRKILPDLAGLTRTEQGRPAVRVFEGDDAWDALQRDILASGAKEVFDLSSGGEPSPVCQRGGLRREILDKCNVYSLQSVGAVAARRRASGNPEVRRLEAERFPVLGDAVIYGTKVFLVSRAPESVSVMIDGRDISATLLTMFRALWQAAE